MLRRYNTIVVDGRPKLTDSVTQFNLVEHRYVGVVVECDTDDDQHAEMIADADISEQVGGPVPESVSGAQAKMALYAAGLLDSVQAIMDDPATDQLFKIFWENTETFERRSPAVNSIAATIGLDQEGVENLLRSANAINP